MSRLHKKMVAMGDMSQYTYEDIAAACGEPKERKSCTFSDIGPGERATWSDGVFTITFNFDPQGKYCGIYHHRNWEPYIWLCVITALVVAGSLIAGAFLRRSGSALDAAGTEALLIEREDEWLTDSTAGACLLDLDFDGAPELLSTQSQLVWYEEDEMFFFGPSAVTVRSVSREGLAELGGFTTDEYCFLAALHLYSDSAGNKGWYYVSEGDVWLLTLSGGVLSAERAASMPDVSGGDSAFRLIRGEAWISADTPAPDRETVRADISAAVAEYYQNQE